MQISIYEKWLKESLETLEFIHHIATDTWGHLAPRDKWHYIHRSHLPRPLTFLLSTSMKTFQFLNCHSGTQVPRYICHLLPTNYKYWACVCIYHYFMECCARLTTCSTWDYVLRAIELNGMFSKWCAKKNIYISRQKPWL